MNSIIYKVDDNKFDKVEVDAKMAKSKGKNLVYLFLAKSQSFE